MTGDNLWTELDGRKYSTRSHQMEAVYLIERTGEHQSRCDCGWRSEWVSHCYAAERALITHLQENGSYSGEMPDTLPASLG